MEIKYQRQYHLLQFRFVSEMTTVMLKAKGYVS